LSPCEVVRPTLLIYEAIDAEWSVASAEASSIASMGSQPETSRPAVAPPSSPEGVEIALQLVDIAGGNRVDRDLVAHRIGGNDGADVLGLGALLVVLLVLVVHCGERVGDLAVGADTVNAGVDGSLNSRAVGPRSP
jgi:hypothetical protein